MALASRALVILSLTSDLAEQGRAAAA